MVRALIHIPVVLLVVIAASCGQNQSIVLTNNADLQMVDKPVVMERNDLPVSGSEYFKLMDGSMEVPVQFDDFDGDGRWDEVAFECSLEPKESVELRIEPTNDRPTYEIRTNAYLGYSPERNNQFSSVAENERPADHVAMSTPYLYQFEGPAWESDLVVFRSYFDSRNGKDIFGKVKPLIRAEIIGTGENYHELQDWGMDVLKVGGSLGAGALAMLKNDSVYRLGETDRAAFHIVTEGPVRTIITLSYVGWEVESTSYDIEETLSIWAGKRSYQSSVVLSNGSGADTLVTGIVNLKKVPKTELSSNGFEITYTHGEQSEHHDMLGMALLIPSEGFGGRATAPDEGEGVTNTFMSYLMPVDGAYHFSFLAGWEGENEAFKSQEAFENALLTEATALNQNIDIKLKN